MDLSTLSFNFFTLIFLFAAFSSVYMYWYATTRLQGSPFLFWFRIIILIGVCGGFIQAFATASSSELSFQLIYGILFFEALVSPMLIYFALLFTEKGILLRSVLVNILILAPTIAFEILLEGTDLMLMHDFAHVIRTPWGYQPSWGPLLGLLSAFFSTYALAALIILGTYLRQIKDKDKRKGIILMMIGLVLPSLGGVMSGIVSAGIMKTVHFPGEIIGWALESAFILFAIKKYSLFTLDVVSLAKDIIGITPEAVVVLDNRRYIKMLNQAARSLLTLGEVNFSNKTSSSILKNITDQQVVGDTLDKLAGEPIVDLQEYEITSFNDHKIPVNIKASAMKDKGKIIGYIIVIASVKELVEKNTALEQARQRVVGLLEEAKQLQEELRKEKAGVEQKVIERTKELAEEQAKLATAVANLRVGVVLFNPQCHVILSNEQAEKILGVGINNQTCDAIQNQLGDKFNLAQKVNEVLTTKMVIDLKEVIFAEKFLRFYATPVFKTELIGVLVVIDDITEEKILDRSKDEFFSIASHELRTPLTAIRGNVSMIKTMYSDKIKDDDFKSMVDDIQEASVRLIGIVNDFLDVSSLEQGRIEFAPTTFDIVPVVEDIIRDFDMAKNVELRLDKQNYTIPHVFADLDKVKQVLVNLAGNSLKFTEQGTITFGLEIEDSYVKVCVSDTGSGIPLQNQSLLFHKFQQAGSSLLTRDTSKGTGLGLYISKLMIEGMGGKIKLEHSEEGKGSTFSFTLPIARKDVAEKQQVKTGDIDIASGMQIKTSTDNQP